MMFLEVNFDVVFVVALIIALILGAILFFLSGFIFNKKESVFIVERLGIYFGTYNVKFKYFFPLLYRRVAIYSKLPYKEEIKINDEKYMFEYKIINFEKFHYSELKLETIIDELNHINDKKTYLNSNLDKIGVKFINLIKI